MSDKKADLERRLKLIWSERIKSDIKQIKEETRKIEEMLKRKRKQ